MRNPKRAHILAVFGTVIHIIGALVLQTPQMPC